MNYEIIYQAKSDTEPCGDAYFISEDAPWLLMLADSLGSGGKARYAADTAVCLAKEYSRTYKIKRKHLLPELLVYCHQKLRRSRGAALGCVVLDSENQRISFCGVGNIRLVLAGTKTKSFCCQPGIVGAQLPRRITTKTICTQPYTTGFLFSDGISLRSVLRTAEHPYRHPGILAEEINTLSGNSDDKTLVVFSIND